VQALEPPRERARSAWRSRDCARFRGLGILAGGAVAQAIGAPLAVGLAGLVGVTAATMLTISWAYLHVRLTQARHPETAA
jgi:hypothetical protein